jgi:hypothetical protein
MSRARLALSAAALSLAAACLLEGDDARIDLSEPGAPAEEAGECLADADCVPAGATCCDCPGHAVSVASGWAGACEEVSCQPPDGCAAVEAACEVGRCVLRCAPVACDLACEAGFAADELGCLVCACAPASAVECAVDTDCVQAPADCCGCARGGVDTAVPAATREDHVAGLGCDGAAACPEVDVCEPGATPRCAGGRCVLANEAFDADPAPWYCGTAEQPSCPTDWVCVLNDPESKEATAAGVGVCRPR